MIMLKTAEEIEIMKRAGEILREVMPQVAEAAKEGVSLKALDALAEKLIRGMGATPSFLNYQPYGADKPYPASICASVNDIVVHGIPTDYKLRSGDVLSLDFGAKFGGYHSDAAVTVAIGKVSDEAKKLIETTKKALILGIKQCVAGNHLGDIGYAINKYVTSRGFYVVTGLTGHGVGRDLHEDPSVFNEGKPGTDIEIKPGMTLAIEPMVAVGGKKIKKLPDDSYVTYDGSLAAHFEHTIAIMKDGPIILT